MRKAALTDRQRTMLRFLVDYIAQQGHSPLIREVQLGCQIASYKSAIDRLNALERKGFVRRLPNKHRGIRLVKGALAQLPAQGTSESLTSDVHVA